VKQPEQRQTGCQPARVARRLVTCRTAKKVSAQVDLPSGRRYNALRFCVCLPSGREVTCWAILARHQAGITWRPEAVDSSSSGVVQICRSCLPSVEHEASARSLLHGLEAPCRHSGDCRSRSRAQIGFVCFSRKNRVPGADVRGKRPLCAFAGRALFGVSLGVVPGWTTFR
jgi:hypothetical protein